MPTYEYACSECGNQWEQMQRITEAAIEVCPKCGKSSAHRLISGGTNFILKGGGWYSDLYSSSKPSKKDEGTSSSGSSSPAESTSKVESKSESKPSDSSTSSSGTSGSGSSGSSSGSSASSSSASS